MLNIGLAVGARGGEVGGIARSDESDRVIRQIGRKTAIRGAARVDFARPEGRRTFLSQMLTVAATIPDAAARDQFADRLAHKSRVTEEVVRAEIRRAAAERRTEPPAVAVAASARVRFAEQGLLWALVHRPVEGLAAVTQLDPADFEGLLAGPVFQLAASLTEIAPDALPGVLRERLSEGERVLLERAAQPEAETAKPSDCVNAIKRLRYDRERARVQEEIDRLQDAGSRTPAPEAGKQLAEMWERKKQLLRRLEELSA